MPRIRTAATSSASRVPAHMVASRATCPPATLPSRPPAPMKPNSLLAWRGWKRWLAYDQSWLLMRTNRIVTQM